MVTGSLLQRIFSRLCITRIREFDAFELITRFFRVFSGLSIILRVAVPHLTTSAGTFH